MSRFNLVLYPDAVLRQKAEAVGNIDGHVNDLVRAMKQIMYKHRGIGLAAPQVGYLQRVVIADVDDRFLVLINPEILQGEGTEKREEGCLSLPDIHVDVSRKTDILVRAWDLDGREQQLELRGLMARVVQHEIDHLNGRLIIDYANTMERLKMADALEKLEKRYPFK